MNPNLSTRTLERLSPALARVARDLEPDHRTPPGFAAQHAEAARNVRAVERALRCGPRDADGNHTWVQPWALRKDPGIWQGVSEIARHTTRLWVRDPSNLRRGDGALLAAFLARVHVDGIRPATCGGMSIGAGRKWGYVPAPEAQT